MNAQKVLHSIKGRRYLKQPKKQVGNAAYHRQSTHSQFLACFPYFVHHKATMTRVPPHLEFVSGQKSP